MTKDNNQDIGCLELKDWKEIESGAVDRMRIARKEIAIAKIMYGNAVSFIKKLGGKTDAEIDKEIKENAKKQDERTA